MKNPYQSSAGSYGNRGPTSRVAPTGLKVLAIFSIILASLGILASLLGIVGALLQGWIAEQQANMPNGELQAKIAEVQQEYMVPGLILILLNLVVAPMLIVGGAACLRRVAWGRGFFRTALLVAGLFVLLRLVVNSIVQFFIFSRMTEVFEGQVAANGGPDPATVFQVTFFVSLGVAAVLALGIAGFYFWGWSYMNTKPVVKYLG